MRILAQETAYKEGQEVELAGWVGARRDHGKIIFIDLRDRSGIVQLVFAPHQSEHGAGQVPSGKTAYEIGNSLRSEWVVRIKGMVAARPAKMENPELATGKIEVQVKECTVITKAETPPFALDTPGTEIGEEVRMKYRYLDLRRARMQKNIRNRHRVIQFIRDFLTAKDFVEVETPILGKSTPEGARDYLVPARFHPGKFYALPQSPQQYKQLLMVAGLERYFQIARCFRDEDTRGDRQPEFTQLDLEMSFTTQEEVLSLMEELYTDLVTKLYPNAHFTEQPFPRLRYADVMKKYNSDKPDLRTNKEDPHELAFAFVVDFPMFEWKETEQRWDAVHHPFTMPKVKDAADFKKQFRDNPSKILAFQYDLVLNGYEIGGGSIRIHDPALLTAVFEAMGNKPEDVKEKFGHILEAFTFGVPPHGGMASGLDRAIMLLEKEPSIREVIAFPKTGDGRDLLMGAPAGVDPKQLKELKLQAKKQ